jgi:hypothetical protein
MPLQAAAGQYRTQDGRPAKGLRVVQEKRAPARDREHRRHAGQLTLTVTL